jgi:hypothetical protein
MKTTAATIICRHLRTKKMYMDSLAAEAFADKPAEHASPCHVWCNLTQSVKGGDDKLVHKDACIPGRGCFEE